jgi:hypothetical protein
VQDFDFRMKTLREKFGEEALESFGRFGFFSMPLSGLLRCKFCAIQFDLKPIGMCPFVAHSGVHRWCHKVQTVNDGDEAFECGLPGCEHKGAVSYNFLDRVAISRMTNEVPDWNRASYFHHVHKYLETDVPVTKYTYDCKK